jgi:hypothetical protein
MATCTMRNQTSGSAHPRPDLILLHSGSLSVGLRGHGKRSVGWPGVVFLRERQGGRRWTRCSSVRSVTAALAAPTPSGASRSSRSALFHLGCVTSAITGMSWGRTLINVRSACSVCLAFTPSHRARRMIEPMGRHDGQSSSVHETATAPLPANERNPPAHTASSRTRRIRISAASGTLFSECFLLGAKMEGVPEVL